eukprot:TRINITY_DN24567_c0_g1_i1.p1 TRINITY_DN24567_c0_g1~~TRINITY_DN24567_c0_g1_i1.p1  ORF type:complete len:188 (-),score=47.46 TRINITY_DN24567_c0_g1_i1:1-564(-)
MSLEWESGVPLFGGAISCDLPRSFHDAAEFREVPDHQEVRVDTATDRSVIVEILERKDVPDDQAVAFFLKDLASFNDALEDKVLSNRELDSQDLPHMPAEATCLGGVGEQLVSKFGESAGNRVHVHACAIRLEKQQTDILITLNNPVAIDPQSSSGGLPVTEGAEELFSRVIKTFRIIDWNLFGEDS